MNLLLVIFVVLAVFTQGLPQRQPNSPFLTPKTPDKVWVHDVHNRSFDEVLLLQTLSGIIAQSSPEVFLVDSSQDWSLRHERLVPATVQKRSEFLHNMSGLVNLFAKDIAGYILCDSTGAHNESLHIGVSLSGILKGIVATQSTQAMVEKTGLTKLLDTADLTLEQVFHKYSTAFSARILFNQKTDSLWSSTDYAVFNKAWTQYDPTLGSKLSQLALTRLSNMSVVMGWADEVNFVGAAAKHGHFVLCSDLNLYNLPLYSSFEYTPPPIPSIRSCASPTPAKHTVMFMFTDGDSVTWDLGVFSSPSAGWWGSPLRGTAPIAWTMQPALAELHPLWLASVQANASVNDTLVAGPSGAGYTYLDQYPDHASRQRFAQWTSNLMRLTNMAVVNQIATSYHEADIAETLHEGVDAIFLDDYYLSSNLSGRVLRINNTVITARRYALSKSFGVRVNPDQLVDALNAASATPNSEAGYSVVGVEVWGYGVKDIQNVVSRLNHTRVRVVSVQEYIDCLRQHAT